MRIMISKEFEIDEKAINIMTFLLNKSDKLNKL